MDFKDEIKDKLQAEGGRLRLHVQPKAKQAALRGWLADGTLKVAVTAAPEQGKANDAVVELLARELGLNRSAVAVVSGQASRHKVAKIII